MSIVGKNPAGNKYYCIIGCKKKHVEHGEVTTSLQEELVV